MSHMDLPSSIPTTRRVGYRGLVLCGSGIDQGQRPCQFNPQLPELVDKSGSDGGSFYKNVAFYESIASPNQFMIHLIHIQLVNLIKVLHGLYLKI